MKTKSIFLSLMMLLGVLSFSTIEDYHVKKNTAEVEQVSGLFVFVKSQPVMSYTVLGDVNMPQIVLTGKPSEMLRIALQRAKKQFPKSNAIIILSDDYSLVKAIAIE
jgi:hypothetical protein